MELDLKNVRVTYTIREVIAVIALIAGLVGHVIRTEVQDSNLQAQVAQLRGDVADCKQQLAQERQRSGR